MQPTLLMMPRDFPQDGACTLKARRADERGVIRPTLREGGRRAWIDGVLRPRLSRLAGSTQPLRRHSGTARGIGVIDAIVLAAEHSLNGKVGS